GEATVTLDEEGGEAGGEVIEVQPRDAGILRRRGTEVVRQHVDFVFESAEAHVQHGRRRQRVIEAEGEALVTHFRRTAERYQFVAAAPPERLRAITAEVGEAVPAEHVESVGQTAVETNVERIVVEKLAP